MKNQPLRKRLEEIKFTLPKESERKLIEIIKEPEKLDSYKIDIFEQWVYIFNFYKKLVEEDRREFQFGTPLGYVFLGVLAEGLVKTILFFDNPNEYLDIELKNRTLGKLKSRLINLLKGHKKESNGTKIKELNDSLELISSLRNNFIHFPFYYSDDYRFRWVFFQVFAYLLDKFSLWEYLGDSEGKFIKEMALEKPAGVLLLEVDLYEQ
ncbi:MAG: hypothetical protein WA977_00100 [Halobacteriota archaeon]